MRKDLVKMEEKGNKNDNEIYSFPGGCPGC